jgi:uncharacterized phiE125 gp8 family phage protein
MFIYSKFKILNIEPQQVIALDEVKQYLRVSYNYDDKLLKNLTEFAIDHAENFISLSIRHRLVEFKTNNPRAKSFLLKHNPVITLESVCFAKEGKKEEELSKEAYHLDEDKWMLCLADYISSAELKVNYYAGISAPALPSSIKQGILLHIEQMYDNSEARHSISADIRELYQAYRKPKI